VPTSPPFGCQCFALGVDGPQQIVIGPGKESNAFIFQALRDCLQLNPGRRELTDDQPRLVDTLIDPAADDAVVEERLDRGPRHGIDGIGADQLFDVEDVPVGRVLD
jgi:hypothetical protein